MRTIAISVLSVDGRLTRHAEEGVSFSSPADQKHFIATLASCDASIMGRGTFDAERDRIVSSAKAATARNGALRRYVMTRSPAAYESLRLPDALEFTDLGPHALLETIESSGAKRVAIVGGSRVYADFAAEDLVDEWCLTIEPRLFGTGKPLITAEIDAELRLIETRPLSESTLLLRYEVVHRYPRSRSERIL